VQRLALTAFLVGSLGSGCLHRLDGWESNATGTPGDLPLSQVVSEALPNVVLLFTTRADGKTGFGSGPTGWC